MKLSLVVPCYNEAESVHLFLDAVIADFDGCGYDYEVIFVNDGSRDNTLFQLKKLYAARKCPTKVVSFSRNFGKEAAVYAGMREAVGEYVALIDADLQQQPAIVRNMVSILEEKPEIDVVAAYPDRRGEGKVLSFPIEGTMPYHLYFVHKKKYLSPEQMAFRDYVLETIPMGSREE